MKQLHRKDLYGWSKFHEPINVDFNSVLWVRDGGNVVIDPLPLSPHDLAHLQQLGGAALIVITNSAHLRGALELKRATGATLLGPSAEREKLVCDRYLTDGEEVVPGLVVRELDGSKTPGELALVLEDTTLISGDLVRAHRADTVMLLGPEQGVPDSTRAVVSLRRLLHLHPAIETILMGDGWSLFGGGHRRLTETVGRETETRLLGLAMNKPTLTYFDIPTSRGEECRLALFIAGVPFTDERLSREQWEARKSAAPFGALPLFTSDGRPPLSQSNAILRMLGGQHGLLPTDPWESARHEAVMCAVEEMRAKLGPTGRIKDPAEKQKAREALATGFFPEWNAQIEKQITGPFLGGAKISVADLKIFVALSALLAGKIDHIAVDTFKPFPKLLTLTEAVKNHPKVVAWYAR